MINNKKYHAVKIMYQIQLLPQMWRESVFPTYHAYVYITNIEMLQLRMITIYCLPYWITFYSKSRGSFLVHCSIYPIPRACWYKTLQDREAERVRCYNY